MNWVDGIIIAVLIISTLRGYIDGFVVALMNVAALITSIIAARLYFADLARYLVENTALYEKVYQAVLEALKNSSPVLRGPGPEEQGLPEVFHSLIPNMLPVPAAQDYALSGIAQAVSGIIINLFSIVLIFIAVRIAFVIITMTLNSLVKLPVLKQFNKLGGVVAGFAKGIVGLMLAFALVIPVTAVFPAEGLLRGIEGSAAAVYFFRYNLIVPWALEVLSRIL